MEITLLLPGPPRTKKTSNQIIRTKDGRQMVLPSAEYLAWFKEQMSRARVIRHQLRGVGLPLTCMVEVDAKIYRETNHGDLLGYEQAIGDLLQCEKWSKPLPGRAQRKLRDGLGIIADDRQIESWDGSRRRLDPGRPRIELKIRTLEEFSPGLFAEVEEPEED